MGKDKDEESADAPKLREGLAGSQVDADRRRNISARSRSSSRLRSETVSSSIDVAKIGEMVSSAFEKGASSVRGILSDREHALKNANERIDKLLDDKEKLLGQLGKMAEHNVTQQLIEGRERLDAASMHEVQQTIRVAIQSFGPAAAPLLDRAAKFLLPLGGDTADKGDKSPRSCAIRVFAKMQDGSEVSRQLLSTLEMFAEEDWPGCVMFLASIANAPEPQTPGASH